MKKAKVTADIGKNRLFFKLGRWVNKKDLDSFYTDVRFCVADLQPGFHVITDFSDSTFGSLNAIGSFRKIMHYLMEKQVGQVIRSMSRNSLIYKQIINLSARQQGYKPIYVTSLEEAEKHLKESDRQRNLCYKLNNSPVHFSVAETNVTGSIREICAESCIIESETSALKKELLRKCIIQETQKESE